MFAVPVIVGVNHVPAPVPVVVGFPLPVGRVAVTFPPFTNALRNRRATDLARKEICTAVWSK